MKSEEWGETCEHAKRPVEREEIPVQPDNTTCNAGCGTREKGRNPRALAVFLWGKAAPRLRAGLRRPVIEDHTSIGALEHGSVLGVEGGYPEVGTRRPPVELHGGQLGEQEPGFYIHATSVTS